MTLTDLVAWADRNGRVLISLAKHEELCANAAAAITAQSDLDRELADLLGRGH
jgi:hypothetical protein